MAPDKQALSNANTRQKVIGGILILVILVFLYMMFGRSSTTTEPTPVPVTRTATNKPGGPANANANNMVTPKPAELPQPAPMTERELQLQRLQQETQARYLEALTELQILRVNRDIANANKDISNAKLARVQSEKKIVDMLAPPAPPPIAPSSTIKPVSSAPGGGLDQDVTYTVVSVSQLQYRWGAVVNYKGNLYNVHVGDVLPPDGSTVSAISKNGVTLQKEGVKKMISLVPII